MGCCAAGAPASGLPGSVVRANDSGLEGAWVLIQAERVFSGKVCVSGKPQGAHLTSLRFSYPTVNFLGKEGGM